ncbi:sugar ABC transporter substrate-binding protein [filamentous cyanobacterium CCP1]|nr:sugar ABC transporter substrate-binding protein [filamentous cyanobacterium CCP2]PSB68471.1 sugar ABC transporter substrate-binding protein [filamentous cyanobacterium CCP1]
MLISCQAPTQRTETPTTTETDRPTDTPAADVPASGEAAEALAELQDTVLSRGPNGEEATPASEITLTDEEIEQIREMNATAAILLHYGGNDWAVAQLAGLREQFDRMGINIIATTDANFRPETQVANIETVLAQNPDIIISLPTDPSATADGFRRAAAQGVHLIFMDNVPQGFQPGEDYVSVVSADNYGNGVVSAHLMAQELGGQGNIGVVYHAADFFVTQQRYDAFRTTIEENYPNMQIVEEHGIGGPDFSGEADRVASAMLTRNPNLNGIWAVWDVPAEGVMSAVRTAGRDDVIVTTIDLGRTVAIDLAQGGIIRGIGAQRPFDQGVTEAMLAGYALLGKEAPPYVALNALPVTQENIEEAWTTVYHQDPPNEIARQ